jgi:NAD(P)-dependent dehydrogenase (short-subunit alcohol dehydrogenase family)
VKNVFDLGGRTAFVSGAGQGVGRQICLYLAQHGAGTVVVNDLVGDRALAVAALSYAYARRHAHDPRFGFGTGKLGDLAAAEFKGTVRALPRREDVSLQVNEKLIVELYSK